jgi:hypothetical protein
MSVGRSGEGWQHRTANTVQPLLFCFFLNILVITRLLLAARRQLYCTQDTNDVEGFRLQFLSLELLLDWKQLVLHDNSITCLNGVTAAAAEPDSVIITVITGVRGFSNQFLGYDGSSSAPAKQLRSIIRARTRIKEAVHAVLDAHETLSFLSLRICNVTSRSSISRP